MHGTVERDRLEIIAESNERIVEIAVHEGDHVQAGTVLVRQEAGIAQPRIDQSRAAVLEAQRRLADLEQGPRQREIDEARATLGGAESELQTAQSEFARVQTLVQRKLLSAVEPGPGARQRETPRERRVMRPAPATNCCSRGRAPSRWLQPARPSSARPPRWRKSKRLPRATP